MTDPVSPPTAEQELRAMLAKHQWAAHIQVGGWRAEGWCPECHSEERSGHKLDCGLARLLPITNSPRCNSEYRFCVTDEQGYCSECGREYPRHD